MKTATIPLTNPAARRWTWFVAASGSVNGVRVHADQATVDLSDSEDCETYTMEGNDATCCETDGE